MRMVDVRAASALATVQPSNVSTSGNIGAAKWSINQTESKPAASAQSVRSTMSSKLMRNCGKYKPNHGRATKADVSVGAMIRAVVFDFDGLIFDSEGPLFTAWQEAFAAYGCSPLTVEEWSAEIGTVGVLDIVGLFRRRATRTVDINEMQQRRRARVAELLALEGVQPGVHAWLDEADALGYPCAVASSSEISWVEPRLEQLGLRSRFVHVVCRSETIAAKPAPDSYLAACAALGVEPHEALAIEDSPHGVTAAKCAGLACVAVPHAITEQLDLSHADLCVDSLADVTLTQTLANLRQAGS